MHEIPIFYRLQPHLKKIDTPVIDGLRAYYNFTKKHGALGGKTPAEQAMIKVDGKNKWITLIQNASLHKENSIRSP